MIAGWVQPDSGTIEIGQTVKIGYFSQENEAMDENLKVIDYIRNVAEYVQTKDGSISASQMLERFLFPAVCSIRRSAVCPAARNDVCISSRS